MKIVGMRPSSFKGQDGGTVSGVNFYLTAPLTSAGSEGLFVERVYLTESRVKECGFQPKVGDEVDVEYNRYGRCSGFRLVSPAAPAGK